MKKLFYLVRCFVLVAGSAQAGAGGNSVKQENPRQAGKSSIYNLKIFFDILDPISVYFPRLGIFPTQET